MHGVTSHPVTGGEGQREGAKRGRCPSERAIAEIHSARQGSTRQVNCRGWEAGRDDVEVTCGPGGEGGRVDAGDCGRLIDREGKALHGITAHAVAGEEEDRVNAARACGGRSTQDTGRGIERHATRQRSALT